MSMSCDKFPRILPQNLTTNCRKYVVMLRFCRIKVQYFPFFSLRFHAMVFRVFYEEINPAFPAAFEWPSIEAPRRCPEK